MGAKVAPLYHLMEKKNYTNFWWGLFSKPIRGIHVSSWVGEIGILCKRESTIIVVEVLIFAMCVFDCTSLDFCSSHSAKEQFLLITAHSVSLKQSYGTSTWILTISPIHPQRTSFCLFPFSPWWMWMKKTL